LREALEKAGVKLLLSPGDVVTVKDKDIRFALDPHRTPHERRFCIILSNDFLCATSPILSVLPMSHQLDKMSSCDLKISRTRDNGLEQDSYAVMEQIQPILRTSVKDCMGKLSLDDWEEILKRILENYNRA
jgi:mRNA-degrading endonuclease toxin of MazEF toxin-antitoxin module